MGASATSGHLTSYVEAAAYVGTSPTSGLAQTVLLQECGLGRADQVLEIGCGALHLAKPLLVLVDRGHYRGMDPNGWLRHAARQDEPLLERLCDERDARFSTRDDFDGYAAFGIRFDVVVAHSVLSHASRAQTSRFMAGVSRSLIRGGFALVSLNFAPDGQPGAMRDEWVYPEAVTVEREFVELSAGAALEVTERPDLGELYRSWCPDETHDWIVLTRTPTGR